MNTSARLPVPAVLLLALSLPFAGSAWAEQPAPVSPFDGKTLDGWEFNPQQWRVENGEIVGEIPDGQSLGRNEFIFWNTEVHDFDLTVEYKITGGPSANSGIQFRTARLPNGEAKGYQADLDDGAVWLGRIYEENGRALIAERGTRSSIAPDGRRWVDPNGPGAPESFRPFIKDKDWNTYHIHAAASHVELWVNGVLFTVLDDHQTNAAKYSGRIAFQLHSGPGPAKIEYRNIRFQDLGASELPGARAGQAAGPVGPVDDPSAIKVTADGKNLNLDFEAGTRAGWKAEGYAWTGQPIKGDTVKARKPGESSNHVGEYWIGGYEQVGDKGTGTLTSPTFTVDHPWASFLVGGGADAKQERVEVVEEGGKVISSASGADSETMRRVSVNLETYKGHRIFIRLVDNGAGGWGHLNFDDFVFHDKQPTFAAAAATPAVKGAAGRENDSPVLWHLRPNPAKPTAVDNAPGQKLVAGMTLTTGFQAELIAAEPDIKQPVAFAWDERGRIWVAEAYSYPNRQPEGKGLDRILIFEDVDGDGTFKKKTVFIEGLNLVSALEVGYGGVWVGAAPELLFIPDRNHDDKPDSAPEVLLDGWGFGDTHETINSFSWGPDGWLYGNQGVFNRGLIGKPGTPKEQRVALMPGVWRYHPIRREFEIYATGGSNQWGLDFNDVGHLFMTHCRSFFGGGGCSYVIRNGYYWNQTNSNYAPFISNAGPDFAPDLKNYLLAASRYDDGEGGAGKPGTGAVYGGHAHVGTLIYLGDNWPEIYRDHVFTNNIFGAQLNHEELVRQGAGYEGLPGGYDLLHSSDPTYLPVDIQTGPDGAVYMIDWCDTQHCHVPNREKWDRSNGRLYRISWAATYKPRKVDLGAKSDLELAQLQTQHNDWYCRQARQLLQERATEKKIAADAIAALRQLAKSPDPTRVLRAMWTLYAVGALDGAGLAEFAKHPSDDVRGWAVTLATEQSSAIGLPVEVLVGLATSDPSSAVRLALASALPALPAEACWTIATALAAHGEDAADRFLPKMVWFGLAKVAALDFPRALAIAGKSKLPSLANSIRWFAAANPQGREALVAQLVEADDVDALRGVKTLAFGLKNEAAVAMPKAWPQAQARLEKIPEAKGTVDQLATLFGDKNVLARTRGVLADPRAKLADRKAAFELLKRAGDPEAVPVFAGLLDIDDFRSAVIPLLGRSTDPATATALLQRYASFNEADRAAALLALTSRPVLALPLVKAVQAGSFEKKQITAMQIRQLRNLNDPEVNKLLEAAWGRIADTSEGAKATIAKLKKAYSEAPLWSYSAENGQKTFARICAVCHTLNGAGGKLGPDLSGSWRNGVDYFLDNIVDPNAVVGEDYQMHVITKKDGSVVSGMLEKETDSTVVIRTITETINVAKGEIKDRKKLAQSIMPPGQLEAMSEREALELLKFLANKN